MRHPTRRQLDQVLVSATILVALVGSDGLIQRARAGDWPQILGPTRSGIAENETISNQWPPSGLPILWRREIGAGHAGVAVVHNLGVLFHRLQDVETVEVFDAQTGTSLWRQGYPTDFTPQVGGDNGPLCVPTIASDAVITFGPQGVLSCWELRSGKRRWQRMTHREFDAREGYFGAGSSPLVVGDRVLVNVGGIRQGAGIVAFGIQDGQERWRAVADGPSYSSPILANVEGQQVVVAVTRLKCVGLDPDKGTVLFEIPFGERGATVNGATPVVVDDHVFLTASYGIGAVFVRMKRDTAEELYRRGDSLSSQYTTPILIDDYLIGIDGRDDIPPAHLTCIDLLTGRALWIKSSFGYATLIHADDKLLSVSTDGDLALLRPRRERFEELGRFHLTEKTLRALPALSNGRLYVRDSDTLYCVDLSPGR